MLPLLVALVLAFFMQGSRGIYESTEGRYSECAREMVASGNLLEPVLNGAPHWTKPPLTYWAIAGGTRVFGNTLWGARLYLALAFVLTVAAVHLLEGFLWGGRPTGYAALIYAAAPYTVMSANIASTDTLLTLWEVAAMAFFWAAYRRGGRTFVLLMWTALGLAFATKGPVGLFPLVAIVPANRLLRKRNQGFVRIWDPLGLILFAVIGLSWYVYVVARHPNLLHDWFMEELVGRTMFDAHARLSSKPHKLLSVYLPIVLFGAGPWLPFVLFKQRKQLRRGLIQRLIAHRDDGAAHLFLLLATVVPLLVFSASTSRLPLYLLPIFAPMTVALARVLVYLRDHAAIRHKTLIRVALVTALLVAGVKGGAAHQSSWKNMTELVEAVKRVPPLEGDHPLLALFRSPLNGLSFQLGHALPVLYFDGSGDREALMRKIKETGGLVPLSPVANGRALPTVEREGRLFFALPRDTDVIVRKKDAQNFGPLLGENRWQVVAETRHWQVLRLNEAFDIPAGGAR